ncbi:hypothetical protein HDV04_006198 [Boothiomyces sp. JEL0838]|nr:hypothetical protein HDV04_006198 [Boothiomyces sp. JEL0838]
MKDITHIQYLKDSEFKRVLVLPLDHSDYSKYTVDWCKEKMLLKTDKIILVNVRSVSDKTPYMLPYVQLTGYDHDLDARMKALHYQQQERLMESYCKELQDFNVEFYIGVGDKTDLADFIDGLNADLIIMGQRGESLMKLLWGSYSKYILDHCKAPVLIVKK